VTAWHNPWPELMKGMCQSPHIKWDARGDDQQQFIRDLCENNGIPQNNLIVMPQVSHRTLASIMNQTDLGVFPNRCEGGTNLVLMEYMSCGKAAIISDGHGHSDVRKGAAMWIAEGYANPETVAGAVKDIVNGAGNGTWIAQNRLDFIRQFTWTRAARTIADKIEELCQPH